MAWAKQFAIWQVSNGRRLVGMWDVGYGIVCVCAGGGWAVPVPVCVTARPSTCAVQFYNYSAHNQMSSSIAYLFFPRPFGDPLPFMVSYHLLHCIPFPSLPFPSLTLRSATSEVRERDVKLCHVIQYDGCPPRNLTLIPTGSQFFFVLARMHAITEVVVLPFCELTPERNDDDDDDDARRSVEHRTHSTAS